MTAKRFTVHSEWRNLIADIKDTTGEIETLGEFVDLLNQLNEENKQLQQRNKRLEEKIQRERTSFTKTHERWSKEAETKIKELSEENERLKIQLQNTSDQRDEFHRGARENANRVGKLEKENEQLKKENDKLHQRIFEMRTNVALDRTEISRQSYTPKEFLDEIEKW